MVVGNELSKKNNKYDHVFTEKHHPYAEDLCGILRKAGRVRGNDGDSSQDP